MYAQGCHGTVFLLGTGALTNGWGRGCLQAYQERFRGCKCGLANSYLAVVADSLHPALSTVQVGVWSPLRKCVFRTHRYARRRGRGRGRGRGTDDKTPRILKQPPPKPFDVHYDYTPLEDLLTAFDTSTQSPTLSSQASSDPNKLWDIMASQLHALLDVPPWRPGEHAIIDVHWLMGEDPVPSPSTALALSGALLRLKMWHKMHLEIVTSREPDDTSRETGDGGSSRSQEWFEMVEGRLCSVDTWSDGLGTIWRGDLHFTERRTTLKQACRKTVVFPGFSLTILHTDTTPVSPSSGSDDTMSCATLLREVGLPETWCTHPTHLEVIHILDMSTLPLIWLSPIHCSLSLVNGAHGDSKLLLRRLFQGKTGLLVRLCFADEARSPVQHKTTADWIKHIQSVDESEICTRTSPSPLMAYETGPVLAVYQSDTREMSCDAWFLWKPEAINNTPFPDLLTKVASEDQTKRPQAASEDQTTPPEAASKDQTTRPPEASEDQTTPPEASEDQTTPPEASKDQTIPPEASKDQTTQPQAALEDQTKRPQADQTIPSEAASSDQLVSQALPVITDVQQVMKDGKVDLSGELTSSRLQEEFRQAEATFKREMELPFSEWPEIQALSTYEWIQRKLVHRVKTPDLLFGQLVAPPPSSATTSCVNADDMLKCFHDTGSPATSELSPITNDISDVVKIHNPEDTVPSFESISAGTPGSKKRFHGVNYCLQPEDSMMDARLTRIQQRYLLSERASNCSSSNTPEVKLEQRRRRRLRKVETNAGSTEEGGRDSGVRTDTEQERLKLTAQQSRGGREGEKGKGVPRADSEGKKGKEAVTSTTTTEPCSTSSGHSDSKLNRSPVLMLHRVKVKEDSEGAVAESQQTTPTRSSVGVKLNRSPVVKLHRILTPPSNQPVNLLNQLTSKHTAEITVEQPLESSHQLDPLTTPSEKQRLELTLSDTAQPGGGAGPHESIGQSSSADTTLRRSPRRNKWIAGQSGGDGDSKEASSKGKSNKKKLEQIIVVALKKNGMQRDHVCFRKCYNRLFNLSKSFLKDLRSSKALISEMHRVVEFNVSQVIDFELRQVHSSQ